MVSDTDIQQERIRQERRRRGEGDVTEDLLWAGAFDPYTVQTNPVSYGDTGLAVTTNTPVTLNRSRAESPVTEESTVNPSLDTSSMIGDSTVMSAGPGMMMLPEATAGGSMTINADDLGEDANREQYEFWANANANGVADLDASIFTGELTEDALLENESFLRAAETVYDMRHGEGAWAAKVAEEGWSAEEAAEELGSDGLDYISDFNFQLWEAGKTGLTIGNKTQEQQIALLYMMRAVEHKNTTWSGAGRAAMSMLTDPVNIGITAVSVLLAIPTFGGSLAVGGAAIAGRGVVGTAVAKAGQVAFMRSLTSTVQSQVTRMAASRVVQGVTNSAITQGTRRVIAGAVNNQATRMITNNVVTRTVGNSVVGRAFNSEIARRAGRYAVVPGMIDSYYTDRMVFNAENAGVQALGYDPMEYSWQRGAFAIGMGGTMGYGMGRVFGAGGQLVGDGFRSAFRRTASEVTPDEAVTRAATTGVEEPTVRSNTTTDGPTTTRNSSNETGPTRTSSEGTRSRTTTEGPNGRVDGDMDGPFTPGDRTAFASASAKGTRSATTTGPHGIEMPNFNPKIDGFKVAAHARFWKWFPVKSMRPRSYGNTRPVIDNVDRQLARLGLVGSIGEKGEIQAGTGAIHRLNQNVIDAIAAGKDNAAITKIINDFAADNKTGLTEFKTHIQHLRQHVVDTYKTNRERGLINGGSEATGWTSDLFEHHKKALVSYLDDMEHMADDLMQGASGQNGAEILRRADGLRGGKPMATGAGPRDLNDFRNSVSGLFRANEYVSGAHSRLTGSYVNGEKASAQWKEYVERSIDVGIYRSLERDAPITYNYLKTENLERQWQNAFLDRYAERNEDGSLKIDIPGSVEEKETFLGRLEPFIDGGFGHEAVFAMEQMTRLAQPVGAPDRLPFPTSTAFDKAIIQKNLGKMDHATGRIQYFNPEDALYYGAIRDIISREEQRGLGARKKTILGLKERWIDDNRPNRHNAEIASYFWEFKNRYRGINTLSTPAWNTIMDRALYYPKMLGAYTVGAYDVKPGTRQSLGATIPDYSNLDIKWYKGDKKTLWNSRYRRALTNLPLTLSTGGLNTKPGMIIVGGGVGLTAAGAGLESLTGHDFFLQDLGYIPGYYGLTVADFVEDNTWARIPYMPDMPIDTVRDWIYQENLTEADIREGLQDVVFDGTTPFHTLPPAQQNAIVSQLAQDDDLSEEHISEVYRNVISSGAGTQTTPQGGQNQTQGGGQTQGGQTQSNGQGGQNQTQGGGQTQGGSTRTRTYSGPQQSVGEAAGDIVGTVGNAAFGWMGDGLTSSVGNFLSGTASWIGGFFNKLASGQVRNGEKWLAGGMGLLAALVGGPMITKALGLDGVPFVGLIIAGLVFGFGGGLAHDFMTGQGSGNHRPNRARRTQQNHDGTTTPETPQTPRTQILATDNPGNPEYEWDAIRASDSDTNGKFAVQMSMDPNKESFVDLRVLNPTEVATMGANAQNIVNQAIAEGRFISNDRLAGMQLDSFDKWEFTAVETGKLAGADNGEVLVFAKPDNSNDYVVLELDQPN